MFVPVKTGITGATDIEVLGGLKAGDEIVTGRYKVLRTLKSGTAVKRDNTPETARRTSRNSTALSCAESQAARTGTTAVSGNVLF